MGRKGRASSVAAATNSRPAVAAQDKDDLAPVIARMKAADVEDAASEAEAGFEAGEWWAKDDARPQQLRSLERAAEQVGACDLAEEDGEGLLRAIDCDSWEDVLGEEDAIRILNHHFAEGFIKGALSIWGKVRHRV
jgi:hypothetical protein